MDFTKMSTGNTTNLSLSPVSEPIQTLISLIYGTIALLSFTFNLATIFVLLKCKICSEVNAYLINLSVSDLIMSCLCIPYTFTTFVLNRWIFPDILCPVANFAQVCSIVVSIWTLTTIGVDRYQLCGMKWRPCHEHKTVALVTIWLLGISVGLAYSWNVHVIEFQFMGKILCDCRENFSVSEARFLTVFLFVFTFGVPLLILVFVYSVIGYQVWCHVTPGNAHQIRDQQSILTREKVIKILILIVVFFFICWAPLQTFQILVEFVDNFLQIDSNDVFHQKLYVYGYLTVHMLAMSHSFVNPVIYCFSSKNFWKHFCHLFRKTVWFTTDNIHRPANFYIHAHHNNNIVQTIDPKKKSKDSSKASRQRKLESIPLGPVRFESVQRLMYNTTGHPATIASFKQQPHDALQQHFEANHHTQSNIAMNSSMIVCTDDRRESQSSCQLNNQTQPTSRVWLDF